jgi:hypothetical protein
MSRGGERGEEPAAAEGEPVHKKARGRPPLSLGGPPLPQAPPPLLGGPPLPQAILPSLGGPSLPPIPIPPSLLRGLWFSSPAVSHADDSI